MAIQVKHMPIHVRYIQVLHGGFQVEALFHVGVQAGMLLICAHVRACQIVCKGSKASCKVHVLHVPRVRHVLHVPHAG